MIIGIIFLKIIIFNLILSKKVIDKVFNAFSLIFLLTVKTV